ncbi:MAG: hypothetical protein ACK5MR_08815, partial [Cumulibacter sp.]
ETIQNEYREFIKTEKELLEEAKLELDTLKDIDTFKKTHHDYYQQNHLAEVILKGGSSAVEAEFIDNFARSIEILKESKELRQELKELKETTHKKNKIIKLKVKSEKIIMGNERSSEKEFYQASKKQQLADYKLLGERFEKDPEKTTARVVKRFDS